MSNIEELVVQLGVDSDELYVDLVGFLRSSLTPLVSELHRDRSFENFQKDLGKGFS